jgi:DNA-binding CsgD family transcriptional regulator
MAAGYLSGLTGLPLTERELAVLRHRAEGHSCIEIADLLGVATGTIRTRVQRILAKLDARDTTHAVAIALRIGVLDRPQPTASTPPAPEDLVSFRCTACHHTGLYRLRPPVDARIRYGEAP